jgi:predicted nucleotidyltransferase component of viral defense system
MRELTDLLEERALNDGVPINVVRKEALQIYALAEIFGRPESQALTLQGGTCLRLVYNGVRYSQDLDLVTTLEADGLDDLLSKVRPGLAKMGPFFGGRVDTRMQNRTPSLTRWKVYLQTADQRDSTSISLEFARFPAYTLQVATLKPTLELPALPLVVVRAETRKEIMADKIVALAGRPYSKGRDVFDLWLLDEQGVQLDRTLVRLKWADYSVSPERLHQRAQDLSQEQVKRELERFLPQRLRIHVLQEPGLSAMISRVSTLLESMT